jgi:hypothetical protein
VLATRDHEVDRRRWRWRKRVQKLLDDDESVDRTHGLRAIRDCLRTDQVTHYAADGVIDRDQAAGCVDDGIEHRNRNTLNLLVGVAVRDLFQPMLQRRQAPARLVCIHSVIVSGGASQGIVGDTGLNASLFSIHLRHAVTRQLLAARPELTVEHLVDIPLIGFYRDTYLGDDSNWFIPNARALADMIAGAGYEVVSRAVFPTYLPEASVVIACAVIKARKVGPPDLEYSADVYSHLRRIGAGVPSARFSIPTWYELEQAAQRG